MTSRANQPFDALGRWGLDLAFAKAYGHDHFEMLQVLVASKDVGAEQEEILLQTSVVIDTSQQHYQKGAGSVMGHPVSPFLVAMVPAIPKLSSAPGEKQAVRH